MRVTTYGLLALLALALTAEPANSQVRGVRGYNPFTGRVGPQIMPAGLNEDSARALRSPCGQSSP